MLGRGGESTIFRVIPYVPMEIVAKVPLVQEDVDSSEMFINLLLEDQLLRMIAHPDYICEIFEEIFSFTKKEMKILGMVSIVECAKDDLSKITGTWTDPVKSVEKVEHYHPEKLAYFCLKAMEAMCYLPSKNVYFGDMKPENLLVFKNYKVKLGDFGVSIKLPDGCGDDYLVDLKGLIS